MARRFRPPTWQFTFQALYDKQVASALASSLLIADQPLDVRAIDDTTIVLTMPTPYGPGLSLLDAIPILPRHKLEAAFKAGTFRDAWGLDDAARRHGRARAVRAQVLRARRAHDLARNPHYWRETTKGAALPKLDEIDLQIVPDQNTELLQAGRAARRSDDGAGAPEDLAALRRLEARARCSSWRPACIDPDGLWFNLTPGAPPRKSGRGCSARSCGARFRYAVDRKAIVGHGVSWRRRADLRPGDAGQRRLVRPDLPKTEHDRRAREGAARVDRPHRPQRRRHARGRAGHPARFSILTQKGHSTREQTMRDGAEQLGKIGLTVDVVSLERRRCSSLRQTGSTTRCTSSSRRLDRPGAQSRLLDELGRFHLWNSARRRRRRAWEGTIDDLCRESTSLDRAAAHAAVRRGAADAGAHMPVIYFAAPQVTSRCHRACTAPRRRCCAAVFWNADVLSGHRRGRGTPVTAGLSAF